MQLQHGAGKTPLRNRNYLPILLLEILGEGSERGLASVNYQGCFSRDSLSAISAISWTGRRPLHFPICRRGNSLGGSFRNILARYPSTPLRRRRLHNHSPQVGLTSML